MKVWIYNIFTTDQMWCICVCKYGICDISAIVHESLCTHLINIVNPNYHAVRLSLDHLSDSIEGHMALFWTVMWEW